MKELLRRWWRLVAVLAVAVAAAVIASVVGIPGVDQFRAWSASVGPGFVVVFFLAHALICTTPVPRTIFTLSSGVLFGPVLGLGVAVSATMVAALLAFVAVRAVGRDTVLPRLTHPAVRAVNVRLARRGWLAVGSLRMIAPVPFSVINYCAAVSSIRIGPYLAATAVGILPGTVSVVILGSVLGGGANPIGLVVSIGGIVLGVAGVVLDTVLPTDTAAESHEPPVKHEYLTEPNQVSELDESPLR